MRFVRVRHGGVSKFISDTDIESLQHAKRSGGEIELTDDGDIRYYTEDEVSYARKGSKVSAEEIFGVASKAQSTRGRRGSTPTTPTIPTTPAGGTPSE